MPIPGPSGTTINANTIQTEFGGSGPISLNEYYRSPSNTPVPANPINGSPNNPAVIVRNTPATLTIPNNITAPAPGVPAAQISYNDFLGTQNRIPYSITVSANAVDYNLYDNRNIPVYAPGGSDIDVTINADVVLTASTTASAGLLIPSQFAPGDTITIHNLGTIYGKGGDGGAGGSTSAPGRYPIGGWVGGAATAGSAGGAAIRAQRPVTIDNQGTIVGGGGGGGGGGGSINYSRQPPYSYGVPYSYTQGKNVYYGTYYVPVTGWDDLSGGAEGGGGGGGGGGPGTTLVGGAAGSAGISPYTPATATAGVAGTYANGGIGGAGASFGGYVGGAGGAGGNRGVAGSAGAPGTGGNYPNGGGAAGAVGPYITGNPFVTWANNGTRIGAIS